MKKKKRRGVDPFAANPLITGVGGVLPAVVSVEEWQEEAALEIRRVGPAAYLATLVAQLRDSLTVTQTHADLLKTFETFTAGVHDVNTRRAESLTTGCPSCAAIVEVLISHTKPLMIALNAVYDARKARLQAMQDEQDDLREAPYAPPSDHLVTNTGTLDTGALATALIEGLIESKDPNAASAFVAQLKKP